MLAELLSPPPFPCQFSLYPLFVTQLCLGSLLRLGDDPRFLDRFFHLSRLAKAGPPPAWIVIAAEPVTDVDTTASDVLEDLDEELNAQGISLVFAELKDPVRAKIERYGLTRTIDPRHFFPTIESAVAAFRQETGADWPVARETT